MTRYATAFSRPAARVVIAGAGAPILKTCSWRAGDRVARVDDQPRRVQHHLVVHRPVLGEDRHAVGLGQRRRRDRLGLHVEAAVPGARRQRRHVRIGVLDVGALLVEQRHHVERRRFAHVVDVALVGDAEDQHGRAVDRLLMAVQRVGDLVDDEVRHAAVDLPGQLDEPRIEAGLLRFPRQVERIDRNAVAAEAGARIEGHEAERLGRRGLDDFPDVEAEPVAHQRDFVDQADVHHPERVLEQLDHLGRLRRADRHDGFDRRAVEQRRQLGGLAADAADHFRHVVRVERRVARIDALRREGEEEIDAGLQPAGLEHRLHQFLGRPG